MLRSVQRLKRFNISLSLQSLQVPLSSTLDYTTRRTNNSGGANQYERWSSFPPIHNVVSHRCFSTTQCDQGGNNETPLKEPVLDGGDLTSSSSTVFEETMDKIFDETQQLIVDASAAEAATAAAKEAGLIWEPSFWKPTDIAVETIRFVHDSLGLEYGWAIVAVTVGLRLLIFPVAVLAQSNQSRMAHMMPEMTILNDRYKSIQHPTPEEQIRHGREMSALFKKYETNPFRAFWLPVIQLPAFLGLFFGLQKMAKYPVFYDDLSVGGMMWFTDLTIPDPLYILPLTSALSFLAIVEITRAMNSHGGMSKSMQNTMTNVMRGLALVAIPVSITFPSAVVAYWTTNNLFTFGQIAVLGLAPVKKAFNIWDAPKPVPGAQSENLYETLKNTISPKPTTGALIKKHNDMIESQQKMKEISKQALSIRKGGRKRRK